MRLDEYPMVLWAEGKRDPVRLIRNIHGYMMEKFGESFTPNTINNNKKIKLDKEYLDHYIWLRTAKDGVFHSYLKAGDELRFSLTLNQPPSLGLSEVLTMNFLKTTIIKGDQPFTFENLLGLFLFTVQLFEPYYGGIWDSDQTKIAEFQNLRLSVDGHKVPYAIHWFNYFGPEMVECLGGVRKLLDAPVFLAKHITEKNGVVVILQQNPFDYTIEEHRKNQQNVQEYLDLDKLHNIYLA